MNPHGLPLPISFLSACHEKKGLEMVGLLSGMTLLMSRYWERSYILEAPGRVVGLREWEDLDCVKRQEGGPKGID